MVPANYGALPWHELHTTRFRCVSKVFDVLLVSDSNECKSNRIFPLSRVYGSVKRDLFIWQRMQKLSHVASASFRQRSEVTQRFVHRIRNKFQLANNLSCFQRLLARGGYRPSSNSDVLAYSKSKRPTCAYSKSKRPMCMAKAPYSLCFLAIEWTYVITVSKETYVQGEAAYLYGKRLLLRGKTAPTYCLSFLVDRQ